MNTRPRRHAARVCFPFVGDSVGGSHISAAYLIRDLDPDHYEPVVVVHQDGPLRPFLDSLGLRHRLIEISAFAGTTPSIADIAASVARTAPALRRFLIDDDIDIVHTNDLRMNLTWPLPARLALRSFVWHQRLVVSPSPLWRVLCAASSRIVSISRTVRDTLPALGRRRASVVPDPFVMAHPPPHETAKANLLVALGIEPPVTVVGFVGNMTHQKRPLIFVEAAARLARDESRQWAFVMVGDDRGGELALARARAAGLAITEKIHFVGHQRPVEPWLAGFDVMLAPAAREGYGRAVVEALMSGTPVAAADSGGHREILVDDGLGLLTRLDDPDSLAEVARVLIGRGQRVPQVLRSRLGEHHAPAQHARRIEAIYDSFQRTRPS